MQLIG